MNPRDQADDDDAEVDENYNPEEEVQFEFKPGQKLPEVPIVTGEENDELIATFRTKLYRWHDSQWKERGVGNLKFLKNKESHKIRVLMRQDKSLKLILNHYLISNVEGLCELKQNKTTEKAWLWTAYDFSDDEGKLWKICGRFTSVEEYNRFKEEFDKAKENNKAKDEKKE